MLKLQIWAKSCPLQSEVVHLEAETHKEMHWLWTRWLSVPKALTRALLVQLNMDTKTTFSYGTKILCKAMESSLKIVATS
jgi:hypothetical protein